MNSTLSTQTYRSNLNIFRWKENVSLFQHFHIGSSQPIPTRPKSITSTLNMQSSSHNQFTLAHYINNYNGWTRVRNLKCPAKSGRHWIEKSWECEYEYIYIMCIFHQLPAHENEIEFRKKVPRARYPYIILNVKSSRPAEKWLPEPLPHRVQSIVSACVYVCVFAGCGWCMCVYMGFRWMCLRMKNPSFNRFVKCWLVYWGHWKVIIIDNTCYYYRVITIMKWLDGWIGHLAMPYQTPRSVPIYGFVVESLKCVSNWLY